MELTFAQPIMELVNQRPPKSYSMFCVSYLQFIYHSRKRLHAVFGQCFYGIVSSTEPNRTVEFQKGASHLHLNDFKWTLASRFFLILLLNSMLLFQSFNERTLSVFVHFIQSLCCGNRIADEM